MGTGEWYALRVRARQERATADELKRRSFEVFLPSRLERRAWSDRIQQLEVALFPGYVFIRAAMTPAIRVDLLKCKKPVELVGRIPGDARIARAIPDGEIESVRRLVESGRHLDPCARLVAGVPVLIAAGPLTGVRGIIEKAADGSKRIVVQVALLGRGVRATIQADDVVEQVAERAA